MKKKTLITSSRDKNLLIFLATLVVLFLIYNYLISPALVKSQELTGQADLVRQELETAQAAVTGLPENRDTDARTFEELTEKYKAFFYEINQERILYQLDTMMTGAGIPVISYRQTPTTVESIPVHQSEYSPLTYPLLSEAAAMNDQLKPGKEGDSDGGGTGSSDKEIAEDALPMTHINVSFSNTGYENVLNFLNRVDAMERAVIIDGITISKIEEGEGLEGDISLSVYALPKLDPNEASDMVFRPVIAPGKANPFQ